MKNAEKIRLIEAYYRGTLTGEDNTNFSKLMNEDLDFSQEVQDYKSIFIGFEGLHLEEFQKTLMSFEAKHNSQEKQSANTQKKRPKLAVIRPLRKFYYAAAAIALLICATFGYNQWMTPTFDQHFEVYQSIELHQASVRGANDAFGAEQKIKKSAYSAYLKNDYSKAISLLEEYVLEYTETATKDYQALLVLGVSQLAEDKTQEALLNLSLVSAQSPNSSYKQEAEWYRALALVKTGAEEEATLILKQIQKRKGHIHNNDAILLLGDM